MDLRYVADKNNYDVTTFPVFGILYGDSNGGKSTFVQLLTKLMTGKKLPANRNEDFTYTSVRDLRRGIEGVPLNFDDLDKTQFNLINIHDFTPVEIALTMSFVL